MKRRTMMHTIKNMAVCLTVAIGVAAGAEAAVQIRNIAHRGLWKEANLPQNTVEAIKAAYDAGAKIVETDFFETKAGEIVCLHDKGALATMSSIVKEPADLTPEDRAAINLGEKVDSVQWKVEGGFIVRADARSRSVHVLWRADEKNHTIAASGVYKNGIGWVDRKRPLAN